MCGTHQEQKNNFQPPTITILNFASMNAAQWAGCFDAEGRILDEYSFRKELFFKVRASIIGGPVLSVNGRIFFFFLTI